MTQTVVHSPANVRSDLSRHLAEALNHGTNHVRVRIHHQKGLPLRASLLAHQENQWHEVLARLLDVAQLPALMDDMAMLASQGRRDAVAVRQVASADAIDTDLQFQNDWVVRHRGAQLASAVEGQLFRDAHASRQDGRRQIRTPRP